MITTTDTANGLAPFLTRMRDEPGDATTLLAAADWSDEHGDGRRAEQLRDMAPRVKRAWAEWVPFAASLEGLRPDIVGAVTTARIHGADFAAQCRALFRRLDIKGVSVTTPRGSRRVRVSHPARLERDYLPLLRGWTDDAWRTEPGCVANRWATAELSRIVASAFPGCDDRSDSMTDYYDYVYMVLPKQSWDYHAPEPRKAKTAAARPDGWESWPVVTVGRADYRVQAGGTFEGAVYTLHAVKGDSVYALMPNQHNPHLFYVVAHGPKVRGGWTVGNVRGHQWFTDDGGTLRPLR